MQSNKILREMAHQGLSKRNLGEQENYKQRLEEELSVICSMGFADYFLIVQDFVNWARKNDIVTGPSRGSAGGSLVSYCLRITEVDPIKYGLYFSRFLNPGRSSSPPDIDCDFSEAKRGEVVKYIIDKYGIDKVAHIATFGKIGARLAIRDTARALSLPINLANNLCKELPPALFGKTYSIEDSLTISSALREMYESDEDAYNILEKAKLIEGGIRNTGIHASGYIISPEPLAEILPVGWGTKRAREKGDELPVALIDMRDIEKLGLIKFDLLGIKTLTIIELTFSLIKDTTGETVSLDNIPLNDPNTFDLLSRGNTLGVFQLDGSEGIRNLAMQIIPRDIEDLAMVLAIYRPGPLASEGLKKYLKVRTGLEKPEYLFPELEPILKKTSGFLVYQESAIEIFREIGGFSEEKADIARAAIGKKKLKKMAELYEDFKEGALAKGISRNNIDTLWEDIKVFSDYAFNKSHSCGYAFISYYTAWLKTHYPAQFLCALLTKASGDQDKIIRYLGECKALNIPVLPPSINKSNVDFSTDGESIRFGLGVIKNLGAKPTRSILKKRKTAYRDIFDFCERMDLSSVNKKKITSLILAGAFDEISPSRAASLDGLDKILEYKDLLSRYKSKIATYKKRQIAYEEREEERKGGSKKASLKAPQKPPKPTYPKLDSLAPPLPDFFLLQKEKNLTGYYISGNPLDSYLAPEARPILAIKGGELDDHKGRFKLLATIGIIKEKIGRDKKAFAFIYLEDKTGSIEAIISKKLWVEKRKFLQEHTPYLFEVKLSVSQTDMETIRKLIICDILPAKNYGKKEETISLSLNSHLKQEGVRALKKFVEASAPKSPQEIQYRLKLFFNSSSPYSFLFPINSLVGQHKIALRQFVNFITRRSHERN